ncbi:MAG TPA: GTPase Era [Gammaproteobacteria bacterium]|nr:GTPase Era [Gammaproteobacteria bacterium]
MTEVHYHCGYVAIIGRPNTGKSTLLNRVLGQKISITSNKPQTTRHRILGIHTSENAQVLYVDTPGLQAEARSAINRYMNRTASNVLHDVNVILFMVEAMVWGHEDEQVLKRIKDCSVPVVLVINKVDKIKNKEQLMPFLQKLSAMYDYSEIIPLSASKGDNVDMLENKVETLLPANPPMYPEDQVTDKSMRFIVAEIIREKLMRRLYKELPYSLTVEIELYEEENDKVLIHAIIWVERESQKGIVIGKKGEGLKSVGTQARQDIQKILGVKVVLKLWTKVRGGWSDDERHLRSFGYTDD